MESSQGLTTSSLIARDLIIRCWMPPLTSHGISAVPLTPYTMVTFWQDYMASKEKDPVSFDRKLSDFFVCFPTSSSNGSRIVLNACFGDDLNLAVPS